MITIAHISDLHLDGTPRNADRARAVLKHLDGLSADLDAVLVTGDIADHGLPGEYTEAREILRSRHPVFTCPGNHDARPEYRKVLLDEPASGQPANRAHRTAKAAYLLCDSSIPGRDDGHLDDQTIGWLESALADTPRGLPVFLAFHHPPVVLHSPPIDAIRQADPARLAAIVTAHPDIAAILCGHAHTPATSTFAGKPVLVAPGVVSTLRLPWEYGPEATSWRDWLDYSQPPALAFHILDDDGRLTTHVRVVPA